MERNELRECPFCGSKKMEMHTTERYDNECDALGYQATIKCTHCYGRISAWAFEKNCAEYGVTAAWNARDSDTLITAKQAEIELIREVVKETVKMLSPHPNDGSRAVERARKFLMEKFGMPEPDWKKGTKQW